MEKMQDTIGKLIEGDMERDAIHVAIAPVVSFEILKPGQHIGFVGDFGDTELVGAGSQKLIGIVDPFLNDDVQKRKRFWMFLYPNTITSLSHNWSHPEFERDSFVRNALDTKYVISREWIESFAYNDCERLAFDELIIAAENWVKHGESLNEGGRFEGCRIPEEFWEHFENVNDKKVDDSDRRSFFSCSC